jgi:hypothetical protein
MNHMSSILDVSDELISIAGYCVGRPEARGGRRASMHAFGQPRLDAPGSGRSAGTALAGGCVPEVAA